MSSRTRRRLSSAVSSTNRPSIPASYPTRVSGRVVPTHELLGANRRRDRNRVSSRALAATDADDERRIAGIAAATVGARDCGTRTARATDHRLEALAVALRADLVGFALGLAISAVQWIGVEVHARGAALAEVARAR